MKANEIFLLQVLCFATTYVKYLEWLNLLPSEFLLTFFWCKKCSISKYFMKTAIFVLHTTKANKREMRIKSVGLLFWLFCFLNLKIQGYSGYRRIITKEIWKSFTLPSLQSFIMENAPKPDSGSVQIYTTKLYCFCAFPVVPLAPRSLGYGLLRKQTVTYLGKQ